jgi:hypothetical protein
MVGLIKEEQRGRLAIVTIDRPERRNAVDLATARALYDAFKAETFAPAPTCKPSRPASGVRSSPRATSRPWAARGSDFQSR